MYMKLQVYSHYISRNLTHIHGLFLTKALSWISSLCRLCLPYDLLYNLIEEGLPKAEVKLIFFFYLNYSIYFRRLPLSGLFQFSLIVSCFHQAQFLRLRQWRDIIPTRSRVCPQCTHWWKPPSTSPCFFSYPSFLAWCCCQENGRKRKSWRQCTVLVATPGW